MLNFISYFIGLLLWRKFKFCENKTFVFMENLRPNFIIWSSYSVSLKDEMFTNCIFVSEKSRRIPSCALTNSLTFRSASFWVTFLRMNRCECYAAHKKAQTNKKKQQKTKKTTKDKKKTHRLTKKTFFKKEIVHKF